MRNALSLPLICLLGTAVGCYQAIPLTYPDASGTNMMTTGPTDAGAMMMTMKPTLRGAKANLRDKTTQLLGTVHFQERDDGAGLDVTVLITHTTTGAHGLH